MYNVAICCELTNSVSCLVNHNHLLIHHEQNVILGDSARTEEHALTADEH